MTTTGEHLVTLSELLTIETAMTHFVAITTGGGGPGGIALADFGDLNLVDPDAVELDAGADLELEADDDLDAGNGDDLTLEPGDDLEVGCE